MGSTELKANYIPVLPLRRVAGAAKIGVALSCWRHKKNLTNQSSLEYPTILRCQINAAASLIVKKQKKVLSFDAINVIHLW